MPLINLRTNLKTTADFTAPDPNLSYGHDRKGFGSSNQPYIVTPIPEGDDNVRSSPDFLLRNGFLNPINSLRDAERLTKFLDPISQGSTLKGALFVLKQGLLEKQNVKVRNGFNRIFNPLQPVAQAGVLSIGYHLNKQGINIFRNGYFNGGQEGYYYITKAASNIDSGINGGENRLALLFSSKQNVAPNSQTTGNTLYDISSNPDILLSYQGGPNAPVLGFGKTNIRIQNPILFKTFTADTSIAMSGSIAGKKGYLTPVSANITKVFKTPFSGYGNFSDGDKNNIYKTSQTSFDRKRNGATKVLNPNLSISPDQNFAEGDDIIDFSFTLINNEGMGTDNPNTFVNFRAYIDEFNDSYTGDWDSYKYMGRAENFYRYKGFTRDMSVSFTVPVLSRADMVTTYQKLNALAWLTMPDYSGGGIMRGNLAYFTMGDYLRRSIVIVKSLNYTPIMEMGFDINRAQDGTALPYVTDFTNFPNPNAKEYVGQLPKGIKVLANIIPLTNAVSPGSPDNFYTPQRGEAFIGNRKHTIKDRPSTIGAQYGENTSTDPVTGLPQPIQPVYTANDPGKSFLMEP